MYFRKLEPAPEWIVQNGRAHFGTFFEVSPKLDIKGMRAPYAGIPLPEFISNLRIKSRLDYIFLLEKFIGAAEFFDFKIFGIVELCFWNRETGKKFVYHTYLGPRQRLIPVITRRGICASYAKKRFVKVSWGRMHQHHALSFKVNGASARPGAEGYVYSPMKDFMHSDTLCVNPSPASSRCSATWFVPMSAQGQISIDGEPCDDSTGLAAMMVNRTYYKLRSNSALVWGIGTVQGKSVCFQVKNSTLDAADDDKYNDNLLVVDGAVTALPSVVITHPFGMDKSWVIQDTESMVDLTFAPKSRNSRSLNVIFLRMGSSAIYGSFDGFVMDKNGNKLVLKNFPGIIEKTLIRL